MLFNVIAGGTKDLGAFGFRTRRFNYKLEFIPETIEIVE